MVVLLVFRTLSGVPNDMPGYALFVLFVSPPLAAAARVQARPAGMHRLAEKSIEPVGPCQGSDSG